MAEFRGPAMEAKPPRRLPPVFSCATILRDQDCTPKRFEISCVINGLRAIFHNLVILLRKIVAQDCCVVVIPCDLTVDQVEARGAVAGAKGAAPDHVFVNTLKGQ